MAGLHDQGAHEHGDVDADGFVVNETCCPTGWCRGGARRFGELANEEGDPRVAGEEAAFVGESADLLQRRLLMGRGIVEKIRRQGGWSPEANIANSGRADGLVLLFAMPIGVRVSTNGFVELEFGRGRKG